SDPDADGKLLRILGVKANPEARTSVQIRAVRDRDGDGDREPDADGGGDGAFGRPAAFQRSARRHNAACGLGRGYRLLSDRTRLLSTGEAEVLCALLADLSRRISTLDSTPSLSAGSLPARTPPDSSQLISVMPHVCRKK